MPGWRPRLAYGDSWHASAVRIWHRLHRLWTALLSAALATALASALAAAALATATLAAAALAAALASPVAAAVHASADVVHKYVCLRAEWRVPGRWTRLAHGSVRRRGSVRVRHGLRRLRRSLHVPAVSAAAVAVAAATLVAASLSATLTTTLTATALTTTALSAPAFAPPTLAASTHGVRRLMHVRRQQRRVPGRRSGLADRLVRRARAVRLRYRLH